MKKTRLIQLLKISVPGILLTGMCLVLSTDDISAQSTMTFASTGYPAGNFMAPKTAIPLLEARMEVFQDEMSSNQPPSIEYLRAYWKYVYYERIAQILYKDPGTSVNSTAIAIENALKVFDDGNKHPISKAEKAAAKQSAIDLLEL